ncbi:MAG: fumarylacetoacetate hydrolase family protein, partial [Terracidiphilus sp.]
MKLYRTSNGNYVEERGAHYRVPESNWDALVAHANLREYLESIVAAGKPAEDFARAQIQAPIGTQEVWAAGVTYFRSRAARMAESKDAGGGDFY